ncbi:MAG: hypothetical protein U9N14_02900, partial [Pseudomonadota bacterium]|nr:hypothetical protein [Pseudomonadota bacterium]
MSDLNVGGESILWDEDEDAPRDGKLPKKGDRSDPANYRKPSNLKKGLLISVAAIVVITGFNVTKSLFEDRTIPSELFKAHSKYGSQNDAVTLEKYGVFKDKSSKDKPFVLFSYDHKKIKELKKKDLLHLALMKISERINLETSGHDTTARVAVNPRMMRSEIDGVSIGQLEVILDALKAKGVDPVSFRSTVEGRDDISKDEVIEAIGGINTAMEVGIKAGELYKERGIKELNLLSRTDQPKFVEVVKLLTQSKPMADMVHPDDRQAYIAAKSGKPLPTATATVKSAADVIKETATEAVKAALIVKKAASTPAVTEKPVKKAVLKKPSKIDFKKTAKELL